MLGKCVGGLTLRLTLKLILVVEDEPAVRAVVVDCLEDAGFKVLEARHAEQALAKLALHSLRVKLLFTDTNMPGAMCGLRLTHHVRENWPWINLAMTSARPSPHVNEMVPGCEFLQKPYSYRQLVSLAEQMTT